jgi:protease-4
MAESHETDNVASNKSRETTIVVFVLVIVAALVAGYYLSTALVPKPKIGIINLDTQVSGLLADAMAREIDYARKADDIKGIVLVVNSPGGSASAGHDIYYMIRNLRDEKPIVASMDSLAASAAYQISVGANEIYAKPASIIGNIGVIMGQPQPETLSEQFLTTGPFKSTGGSATSYLQKLDLLHADFRDSVITERTHAPNPLKLTSDQVATGEIWIGIEAEKYGIIDTLGSKLDAIDRAAELAGLQNYDVVDIRSEYLDSLEGGQFTSAQSVYEELAQQPDIEFETDATKWPTFYQIYMPLE